MDTVNLRGIGGVDGEVRLRGHGVACNPLEEGLVLEGASRGELGHVGGVGVVVVRITRGFVKGCVLGAHGQRGNSESRLQDAESQRWKKSQSRWRNNSESRWNNSESHGERSRSREVRGLEGLEAVDRQRRLGLFDRLGSALKSNDLGCKKKT